MKIAFDHTIFLIQRYGGISRYFCELHNLLNNHDEVKIFSPLFLNEYLNNLDEKVEKYYKIKELPKYSTKIFNNLNFIINNINLISWKPDIIHKTYFNNYEYKFVNAKKVINVWDLSHEIYPELYNKPKGWRPKLTYLNNVDHIICSSEKTKKDLLNFYKIEKKKISVLYQGVNQLNKYNLKNFENIKPYLLYVGSRKKYKNFLNVLNALSLDKKILKDFDLICFGSEILSKEEESEINKLELISKSIKFFNGNDEDLANYYFNAKALIYPSKNEGFGFPPLEAMSYGCPVITSDNEAINESVGKASLKFDPLNYEDICDKIKTILYSDQTRRELRTLGEKRAKLFTWEKTRENLIKIYKNLD